MIMGPKVFSGQAGSPTFDEQVNEWFKQQLATDLTVHTVTQSTDESRATTTLALWCSSGDGDRKKPWKCKTIRARAADLEATFNKWYYPQDDIGHVAQSQDGDMIVMTIIYRSYYN